MIKVKGLGREDGLASAVGEGGYAKEIMYKVFVAENVRNHRDVLDVEDSSSNGR